MPRDSCNRIYELRERSRLTQSELAALLRVNPSTISNHEQGRRTLDREQIRAYAQVFKVDTWEIFLDPTEMLNGGSSSS